MPKRLIQVTPSCGPDYLFQSAGDCCEWQPDMEDSSCSAQGFQFDATDGVWSTEWMATETVDPAGSMREGIVWLGRLISNNCQNAGAREVTFGPFYSLNLNAACVTTYGAGGGPTYPSGSDPLDYSVYWDGGQCAKEFYNTIPKTWERLGCPSESAMAAYEGSMGYFAGNDPWPADPAIAVGSKPNSIRRDTAGNIIGTGEDACRQPKLWYCANHYQRAPDAVGQPCEAYDDTPDAGDCTPECLPVACAVGYTYNSTTKKCEREDYPAGPYRSFVRGTLGKLYTLYSDWGGSSLHQVVMNIYNDSTPEAIERAYTIENTWGGSASISRTRDNRIDVFYIYSQTGAQKVKYKYSRDEGRRFHPDTGTPPVYTPGYETGLTGYEHGVHAVDESGGKAFYMGWRDDKWYLSSASLDSNAAQWEAFSPEIFALDGDPCAQSFRVKPDGSLQFITFNLSGYLIIAECKEPTTSNPVWTSSTIRNESSIEIDGATELYFRAVAWLQVETGLLAIIFYELDSLPVDNGKMKIRVAKKNDSGLWIASDEQETLPSVSSLPIHMPHILPYRTDIWEIYSQWSAEAASPISKSIDLKEDGTGTWTV